MIILTAATSQEIDGIGRCLGSKQRVVNDDCTAWRGTYKNKEVLLVQTGIGRSGIDRMTKSILTSYPATAILSLGFGGALSPDLAVGDLIICASVIPWNDTTNTPADAYYADEELLKSTIEAMNGNGRKWIKGKSATVPSLASNAKEKHGLREKLQAEVCEMEDYWVALAAGARGVPFLAVRGLFVTANDVGDFTVDLQLSGDANVLHDAESPVQYLTYSCRKTSSPAHESPSHVYSKLFEL